MKIKNSLIILLLFFSLFCIPHTVGQDPTETEQPHFLVPSDSLNRNKILLLGIGGGTGYTMGFLALNNFWYKNSPRGKFRLFNDFKEWEQMDKAGHVFASYFQSRWSYKAYRWAGMDENAAIWYGLGTAMLIQSTIEILDGFSQDWGFSIPDIAANVAGGVVFGVQQWTWGEQRISIKVGSRYKDYAGLQGIHRENPDMTVPLSVRANELYGNSRIERFLKDYNSQSIWLSFNLSSFAPNSRLPPWLNIAVGYGAENMMGGFRNQWNYEGQPYIFDMPRYRQVFLSPDIDFTRIPVKSAWWKSFFEALNIIKVPLPGLEWNTNGQLKARWLAM